MLRRDMRQVVGWRQKLMSSDGCGGGKEWIDLRDI